MERCEVCDAEIHEHDFYFSLTKGQVCSACIVEYGFRTGAAADSTRPEPAGTDRLEGLGPCPAEVIDRMLDRPATILTIVE